MAAETVPVSLNPTRIFLCSIPKQYFSIWNDANGTLYILVDGGQSPGPANYTAKLAANAYYESPLPIKQGQEIWGVWAAGTAAAGFAQVQGWEPSG